VNNSDHGTNCGAESENSKNPMKNQPPTRQALDAYNLALGALLTAKPSFQLYFDNDYSARIRFHHLTDEKGVVVETFSLVGEAFCWLLDHDVPFVICHTDRGAVVVNVRRLKPLKEA